MNNTIKTLGIGLVVCVLMLGGIFRIMQVQYENTLGRVAALEQQNNELQDELNSTTDALSSTTDALTEYRTENASLTDAYEDLKVDVTLLQETTTEEESTTEEVNDKIKEVSKEVNGEKIVEASATVEDKEVAEVIPFESDEVESYEETTESSESSYTYYGTKQLTAYCATGNACADGVMPSVGYTVASNDPGLWHKWIYIEGIGDRYVHDTGGMSTSVIDIFMGSYSECIQFGRQSAKVYIYN